MSENMQIESRMNFQDEIKNQIERISNNYNYNFDLNHPLKLDINKIKDLNNKCAELISEEKHEESLKIYKKIEIFLETNILDKKLNLDKKLLVIILHNIACCHQKLKDYDNCISYLDSVIYHYDLSLERKHNININENYLIQHIKENKENYSLLGDLILELRYSAKFHLQMSALLSEASQHIEALKQARLASIICEDNLIKTYYLYHQIRENLIKKDILSNNNKNSNNNNNINNLINNMNNINMNKEDNILLNDKIKMNYKIINELYNIVLNSRNYDNLKNKNTSFSNKNLALKNEFLKENNNNINNKNSFNSYLNYRISEINKFNNKNSLINKVRYIFGGEIKQEDWIQLLNIENILYLYPLNCDDLDLDSDSRFELLKDTILEKIVMLTVSYYCISKEMKFLFTDKNNKRINGEYYLNKAVELSSLFFPSSCPIVKYYINNYYKNYGQNMEIIPEGKIIDVKVNLIRNELEQSKETLSFIKLNKINYCNKIINNNNNNYINNSLNNSVFKNVNLNNIIIPRLNFNNNINNDIDLNNNINSNSSEIKNNIDKNNNLNNSQNIINNNSNKLIIFTDANTNNNTNEKSKRNYNNDNNIEISKNTKIFKSFEKVKKKSLPKKIKKNINKKKPLSSNSINININNSNSNSNSNSNKTEKTIKFINSFNSNKSLHSQSQNNSKNKNKNINTGVNNNPNKKEEAKNKYKNTMKINLNLNIKNNNFDLLPNKNFLNFAKKSKINEKFAPKFKLNFAKLNKSDHESDENDNNEIGINLKTNNKSKSKLMTKTNRTSKDNTGLTSSNDKIKKSKVNKKAFSINLNNNYIYMNGREIKTERLKNPKIEIENNLSQKKQKKPYNTNKKIKLNSGYNMNIHMSPKSNYTSLLMKKKEIKGNKTERTLNKIQLKTNKYHNNINDIRIKFNSPQLKNSGAKTYRFFKFENKYEKNNIFGNKSFANSNNKNKNVKQANSIRYQYINFTQKQKNSKSYYNYNNSNNSNSNKDNMVRSMEIISQLLFNKNKKNNNISSENISFQKQVFKNKINLNKHHFNDKLATQFKKMKF